MLRLARGSLAWLAPPPLLAFLLAAMGHRTRGEWWYVFAIAALFVFGFFLWFFRDPSRTVAEGVASPADGKVRAIDAVEDPELGPADRFSIFMSPKDVHVNRTPAAGRVKSVVWKPGGHLPAFKKESEANERLEIVLDTPHGPLKLVLIAGTVARRIVPYVRDGDELVKGQRVALIRFGSRCDLVTVRGRALWRANVGDQVYAGSTSLGDWA